MQFSILKFYTVLNSKKNLTLPEYKHLTLVKSNRPSAAPLLPQWVWNNIIVAFSKQEKVLYHTEHLSLYCPVFPMQKLHKNKSVWHEVKDHGSHEESDRSTQSTMHLYKSRKCNPSWDMTGTGCKHLLRRQDMNRRHRAHITMPES